MTVITVVLLNISDLMDFIYFLEWGKDLKYITVIISCTLGPNAMVIEEGKRILAGRQYIWSMVTSSALEFKYIGSFGVESKDAHFLCKVTELCLQMSHMSCGWKTACGRRGEARRLMQEGNNICKR